LEGLLVKQSHKVESYFLFPHGQSILSSPSPDIPEMEVRTHFGTCLGSRGIWLHFLGHPMPTVGQWTPKFTALLAWNWKHADLHRPLAPSPPVTIHSSTSAQKLEINAPTPHLCTHPLRSWTQAGNGAAVKTQPWW
jgi:hypothetical protein